jgi:integrase
MSLTIPSPQASIQEISPSPWRPFARNRLMSLVGDLRKLPRFDDFLLAHPDLSPDEKLVLLFAQYLLVGSQATVALYIRYLCEFLNYCQKPIPEIRVVDLNSYIQFFLASGRTEASLAAAMGGVRSFFRRMHGSGFIKANPAAVVRLPKIHKTDRALNILTRALTFDEVETVMTHLARHGSLRDLAIFYVMARLGLRASEATALSWGDMLQVQNQWVLSVQGKGKKARMVALPKEGQKLLLDYRRVVYGVQQETALPFGMKFLPIFSPYDLKTARLTRHGIFRLIVQIGKKILNRKLSPHDLRHTCFTHLAHLKVPLVDIQRAAGHESIGTTSQYVDAGKVVAGATLAFSQLARPEAMASRSKI